MNPDTEEIGRLVRNINEAWKQGRAEQLHDFFHRDIVMVGPGYQELLRGRAACVESYREFGANAKVHDHTESEMKINVWGGTAVCTYKWVMTYERAANAAARRGPTSLYSPASRASGLRCIATFISSRPRLDLPFLVNPSSREFAKFVSLPCFSPGPPKIVK
jgi:ketosteroid isomerase-like protein